MSDWHIDTDSRPRTAVLSGVFRLPTPEAYDAAFAPIHAGLRAAAGAGFTIDLGAVTLMNSSGIRALADLVTAARRAQHPLTFVVSAAVPWQVKTMASLKPLHAQLEVSLE